MPWPARSRAGLLPAAAGLVVLLSACGTDSPASDTAGSGPTPSASASSAASPGPSPSASSSPAPTAAWTLAGGKVVSGPSGRIKVALGSAVRLVVTSDRAAEVHVHGYDKDIEVPAGGSAQAAFTADAPGVFEIELHDPKHELGALQVQ